MKDLKKIAVVGGGTAGLVAALILKTKFPHIDIDVICSSKIGIIGVGEGSTEHWSVFTDFVGISPIEVIKECDASFKSGIMFKGWNKEDYLQSISGRYNIYYQNYPYIYGNLIANGALPKELVSDHAWESKVNTFFVGQEAMSPTVQFHFNTHKLNDFLTKKCIERNIEILDDEILDVSITENNEIDFLVGEKQKYQYDFYIDSTGWKKLLIEKLGASWVSYSRYLKMKQAVVFPSEGLSDIPMWTRAQAMKYGWMFTIPVWGRTGNGYIYDGDFIDSTQAHREIEEFFGKKIDIARQFSFDPGRVDRAWIGNCCAIGLSASFVEPLEASSIGTSIQQAFLLGEKILNYTPASINSYNKSVVAVLDNIRDFISLHYITERADTEFWKSIKSVKIPDSLEEKLGQWRHRLPCVEDFQESSYLLFSTFHHTLVLHGLGLFDIESIRKEYELTVPPDRKNEANFIVANEKNLRCQTIPHRVMLDIIRNIKNENYQ